MEFPATEPGRPGNASWAGSSKVHGGGSDGSGGGLFGNLGRLQQQIKAFGLAGVVAYGLFNTLYYTAAFLIIWTKVLKVPSGGCAWASVRQHNTFPCRRTMQPCCTTAEAELGLKRCLRSTLCRAGHRCHCSALCGGVCANVDG